MTNHLRIALKHLFDSQNSVPEIVLGNYRVGQKLSRNSRIIAIDHLMFNGEKEFHTCRWNQREKTMYVCEGANCPAGEIIFVLRTIRKLGYEIQHVAYEATDSNVSCDDVSQIYTKYLMN